MNVMMQTDCPYLVQKIIQNTAIRIQTTKIAQIKNSKLGTKHPPKFLVVLKLKTTVEPPWEL